MPAMPERLLVNFFYAHPVGQRRRGAALRQRDRAADPELEISVALNAATAVKLASFCPFPSNA
jgi:hypothetical protein